MQHRQKGEMMQTYPLQSMSMEEAARLQFLVVDCMTKVFEGHESLTRGDLGVVMGLNKPVTTWKAEKVIADVFGAEACILVRGGGKCRNSFWTSFHAEVRRPDPGTQGAYL